LKSTQYYVPRRVVIIPPTTYGSKGEYVSSKENCKIHLSTASSEYSSSDLTLQAASNQSIIHLLTGVRLSSTGL